MPELEGTATPSDRGSGNRTSEIINGDDFSGKPVSLRVSLSDEINEIVESVLGQAPGTKDGPRAENGSGSAAAPLTEAERWVESLPEEDRIRVREGIESILKGSLTLAARRSYDAAVKRRRSSRAEENDHNKQRKLNSTDATSGIQNSPSRSSVNGPSDSHHASTQKRSAEPRDRDLDSRRDRGEDSRRGSDTSQLPQSSAYDRDRRRRHSPDQSRDSSYSQPLRDRSYGYERGPHPHAHYPYRPGEGGSRYASTPYGYDNRPPHRDSSMPPPGHHRGPPYAPPDLQQYGPPPPPDRGVYSDYRYPSDHRTNSYDRDRRGGGRPRSPNRERGSASDRSGRDERDDARHNRDTARVRSLSSSATGGGGPGGSFRGGGGFDPHSPSYERFLQRRGSERDDPQRHEGGSRVASRRRSPSSPSRSKDVADEQRSDRYRPSDHNRELRGVSDSAGRRPPSPRSGSYLRRSRDRSRSRSPDRRHRRRSNSRDNARDGREGRRDDGRSEENGRGHRHDDDDKKRVQGTVDERGIPGETKGGGDDGRYEDLSPRSRKSSRRKRHRSRRSRSRSRSPSPDDGRHRRSSRRRSHRESSSGSSSDDDESGRRGGRRHHHRSRKRRHRSRSNSDDNGHARKRSKKKRKDRRKSDSDDRRKSDVDKREFGRERDDGENGKEETTNA